MSKSFVGKTQLLNAEAALEKAARTLALTQLEQHVQVKTAELEFLHAEALEVNWLPEVEKIVAGAKNAFERHFPTTAPEVTVPTPRLTELTQELENSPLPPSFPPPSPYLSPRSSRSIHFWTATGWRPCRFSLREPSR